MPDFELHFEKGIVRAKALPSGHGRKETKGVGRDCTGNKFSFPQHEVRGPSEEETFRPKEDRQAMGNGKEVSKDRRGQDPKKAMVRRPCSGHCDREGLACFSGRTR